MGMPFRGRIDLSLSGCCAMMSQVVFPGVSTRPFFLSFFDGGGIVNSATFIL